MLLPTAYLRSKTPNYNYVHVSFVNNYVHIIYVLFDASVPPYMPAHKRLHQLGNCKDLCDHCAEVQFNTAS